MKKKNILIIVSVVLIIIVLVIFVGFKINNKNKELDKTQSKIESTYKELESDIKDYNSNREIISTKLEDYYTDNLENDYDEFVEVLNGQENIIGKIKERTENLGKICGDRLYPKSDINKICSNYKDYYETVANVFVSDYREINTIIDDYNKISNKGLEIYNTKELVDYVDYNEDGNYLGRD